MQFNRNHTSARAWALAAGLCILGGLGLPLWASAEPAIPDAGSEEYPLDDAVVLRLDEHWALREDGSIRYEYHRWIKLLAGRTFRREGDPRIDFREGTETVEIITARTHLPDGSSLEVPDYSFNLVSPKEAARWPAFADQRQWVVSFSGLQENAVLELHYRRTSKPGPQRRLWGDLRLQGRYPVIQHNVTVTLPSGQSLHHRTDHLPATARSPETKRGSTGTTWSWRFARLDRCSDEPAATAWQNRCGRLRFTNCPDVALWTTDLLAPMESAAVPDQALRKFAADIAEKQVDALSRARRIASALQKRFNFVPGRRVWTGRPCRPAGRVFDSNYGTEPEAAALLTAMFRAVGLEARPMVAVSQNLFDQRTPVDSSVQAFVVAVSTEDGPAYLHPSSGMVYPAGDWADRTLLGVEDGQPGEPIRLIDLPGTVDDAVLVRGQIKIDQQGRATGRLTLRQSGRFVSFESLSEAGAAKRAAAKVLSHVLDGFTVAKVASTELLPGRLLADVEIASENTLPEVNHLFLLTVAEEPPFAEQVHLPLARSQRHSAVHLGSPFAQDIRLVVEYPESWKARLTPIGLSMVSGPWGTIEQTVAEQPGKLVLERNLRFIVGEIAASDFAALRRALNLLRSDAARRLLIGPVDAQSP